MVDRSQKHWTPLEVKPVIRQKGMIEMENKKYLEVMDGDDYELYRVGDIFVRCVYGWSTGREMGAHNQYNTYCIVDTLKIADITDKDDVPEDWGALTENYHKGKNGVSFKGLFEMYATAYEGFDVSLDCGPGCDCECEGDCDCETGDDCCECGVDWDDYLERLERILNEIAGDA